MVMSNKAAWGWNGMPETSFVPNNFQNSEKPKNNVAFIWEDTKNVYDRL